MRIVGGRWRGRPLAAPRSDTIRPTSDRTREAVFNILTHGIPGFALEGVRVLDLFAGTGALGLEALSRGAAYCLFVEEGAEARGLIRTNIEAFAATGITRIFRRDATRLGPMGRGAPYGLAFLDPPYGRGLSEKALASVREGGWLTADAVVVAEEEEFAWVGTPAGFTPLDRRVYGGTQVVFLRHDGGADR